VAKESLSDIVKREGRAIAHCIRVIDRGLRRCNATLEALQPKQPGRITLLATTAKGRGKLTLNETRWRVVRWRIRRSYSDGSVQWQAEMLPLRGAARRTSSKFGFHDTEPQVREVLKAAVALIEWRGRVLRTAGGFVAGVESHNTFGVPQAMKNIERAVAAGDRGNLKRTQIRDAGRQLVESGEANCT